MMQEEGNIKICKACLNCRMLKQRDKVEGLSPARNWSVLLESIYVEKRKSCEF